jgi:nucleotide-binding universal stress UspA family protein
MFKTICVGFDGSAPSENAIRAACDLARRYEARLHIVHAPQPETVAFAMGAISGYYAAPSFPSAEEMAKAEAVLMEKAQALAAEAGCPDIVSHVSTGDAATALTTYAEEVGADLIVTGRRGLGNLTALVLGSMSQSVANKATCAHLTVK